MGPAPSASAVTLVGQEKAPASSWWRWAGPGQVLGSALPFSSRTVSLQLRAQVGAGRCLSVDCSLKAQQQAKAVLKHFNVRVTHADIFSRCQVGSARPVLPRAGTRSRATGVSREVGPPDSGGRQKHLPHPLLCSWEPGPRATLLLPPPPRHPHALGGCCSPG